MRKHSYRCNYLLKKLKIANIKYLLNVKQYKQWFKKVIVFFGTILANICKNLDIIMIVAIGIDIVEIEEIKSAIEKSRRFIERVYTQIEIEYCESRSFKYSSYASRFAAKEATMKALGTGWNNGIHWKQIEMINKSQTRLNLNALIENEGGKPSIKLSKQALEKMNSMGANDIFVSLSHSRNYAVASVILSG